MTQCEWNIAWAGRCKEEALPNAHFCEEHAFQKCCSCENVAVRDCSETMGLVCGAPLCEACEHTIRRNGCNSGVPLDEGMKGHCRKNEQKYKPWYMTEL